MSSWAYVLVLLFFVLTMVTIGIYVKFWPISSIVPVPNLETDGRIQSPSVSETTVDFPFPPPGVFTFVGISFRLGTPDDKKHQNMLIGVEHSVVLIYFTTEFSDDDRYGTYCLSIGKNVLCFLKDVVLPRPKNSTDVLNIMKQAEYWKQEWEDYQIPSERYELKIK